MYPYYICTNPAHTKSLTRCSPAISLTDAALPQDDRIESKRADVRALPNATRERQPRPARAAPGALPSCGRRRWRCIRRGRRRRECERRCAAPARDRPHVRSSRPRRAVKPAGNSMHASAPRLRGRNLTLVLVGMRETNAPPLPRYSAASLASLLPLPARSHVLVPGHVDVDLVRGACEARRCARGACALARNGSARNLLDRA